VKTFLGEDKFLFFLDLGILERTGEGGWGFFGRGEVRFFSSFERSLLGRRVGVSQAGSFCGRVM